MVTDADAIPHPGVIALVRACRVPDVVLLHSRAFQYSFRWRVAGEWQHPIAKMYRYRPLGSDALDAARYTSLWGGGEAALRLRDARLCWPPGGPQRMLAKAAGKGGGGSSSTRVAPAPA